MQNLNDAQNQRELLIQEKEEHLQRLHDREITEMTRLYTLRNAIEGNLKEDEEMSEASLVQYREVNEWIDSYNDLRKVQKEEIINHYDKQIAYLDALSEEPLRAKARAQKVLDVATKLAIDHSEEMVRVACSAAEMKEDFVGYLKQRVAPWYVEKYKTEETVEFFNALLVEFTVEEMFEGEGNEDDD